MRICIARADIYIFWSFTSAIANSTASAVGSVVGVTVICVDSFFVVSFCVGFGVFFYYTALTISENAKRKIKQKTAENFMICIS
jgi:hypothetical protein